MAAEPALTVTSPWKPPGYWLATRYVAVQVLPPGDDGEADGDGDGDGDALGEAEGDADGDADGDGEGDGEGDALGEAEGDGEGDGDAVWLPVTGGIRYGEMMLCLA
ncbi:hypothetical protein [Microbispora sp. H11081]|uniref:hypothetical protein n=1 Tax=Microbispora sp. H11081 TaxID=2729107 RepID=UPI0037CBD998